MDFWDALAQRTESSMYFIVSREVVKQLNANHGRAVIETNGWGRQRLICHNDKHEGAVKQNVEVCYRTAQNRIKGSGWFLINGSKASQHFRKGNYGSLWGYGRKYEYAYQIARRIGRRFAYQHLTSGVVIKRYGWDKEPEYLSAPHCQRTFEKEIRYGFCEGLRKRQVVDYDSNPVVHITSTGIYLCADYSVVGSGARFELYNLVRELARSDELAAQIEAPTQPRDPAKLGRQYA